MAELAWTKAFTKLTISDKAMVVKHLDATKSFYAVSHKHYKHFKLTSVP